MYRNSLFVIAVGAFLISCAQEKSDSSAAEESTVRSQTAAYQEAFNSHDAGKLASLWTKDAVYFNPITGEKAEGRKAIEELFKNKFNNQKARSQDIIVKSIEFPQPGEVVEKGLIRISFTDQPTRQFAYESQWIKQNNQWLLQQIKEIELAKAPNNYDHIKELEWLLGRWEDTDDNVTILFDCQWDQNKNFLNQHFRMQVYGQEALEGKQLIAWDPIQNKVRSWVFDSEGGFGEGKWTKLGDSWYARMMYTLGDGRKAVATNVYTKIDDNTYSFASVGRELDGEILPNVDAVKVTKLR